MDKVPPPSYFRPNFGQKHKHLLIIRPRQTASTAALIATGWSEPVPGRV
jgi:hypothetical protein